MWHTRVESGAVTTAAGVAASLAGAASLLFDEHCTKSNCIKASAANNVMVFVVLIVFLKRFNLL
jgi:hypothetical protein